MNIKYFFSENTRIQNIAYILLGATTIAAFGWVKIPFYPVSFTLHTFAILLIGLTFPPKLALSSVLCYFGLYNPTFITSPYLGYFVGFAIGAYYIAKTRSKYPAWIPCLITTLMIWIMGSLYLIPYVGLKTAIIKGSLIFIPSDLIKMTFALKFAKGKTL